MRRSRSFGPLLIPMMVLGLLVIAGCGGAGAFDAATSDPPTKASDPIATTAAVSTASEAPTTTEIATTSTRAATTESLGTTPTSAAAPESGPDSGTTLTSEDGLPAAITADEIKNAMGSSGMGSLGQIRIYDYKNFGHYAAAYAMAADENVYLVLLNDETGGWAILATYTGLDWEAVQEDLRAKAAPEDMIEWANPKGD